jgi:hypothetical protein
MALVTRIGFVGSPLGSWESCLSLKNRRSLQPRQAPKASLSLVEKAEYWLQVTGRIPA